jgi:hypothetical protein
MDHTVVHFEPGLESLIRCRHPRQQPVNYVEVEDWRPRSSCYGRHNRTSRTLPS